MGGRKVEVCDEGLWGRGGMSGMRVYGGPADGGLWGIRGGPCEGSAERHSGTPQPRPVAALLPVAVPGPLRSPAAISRHSPPLSRYTYRRPVSLLSG